MVAGLPFCSNGGRSALLLKLSCSLPLHAVRWSVVSSHLFSQADTPIMLGTRERNELFPSNTSQLVIVRTDGFLFVWPLQKFQLALLMATPIYQIVKTFPLLKPLSANSRLRWSEGQTEMCVPCYKETVFTAWVSVLNRISLRSLGMGLRVVWCVRTDVSKERELEGRRLSETSMSDCQIIRVTSQKPWPWNICHASSRNSCFLLVTSRGYLRNVVIMILGFTQSGAAKNP